MNEENKMETVEVKHENLQELYKVLTNYPAISKEQVIHELHKCFGKEAFKLKDVTERIKTFEDACKELGENNPLIHAWKSWDLFGLRNQPDVDAYLKLRIIAAALNEGWKPQFTTDELRYFPCFVLYLPIDEMGNEPKYRVVSRSPFYANANGGIAYAGTSIGVSNPIAYIGSRIFFKTRELSEYAGVQFIDIWADYVFNS